VLTREELLRTSATDLRDGMLRAFQQLFPLVLMAISDDPLTAISEYWGAEDDDLEVRPAYSLEECAQDTGFDIGTLRGWVNAMNRKGQAVFYGPPGTGKTFVAEHLAKHLVGGGDGFVELVQFHPAYAYEDFIQGIRPVTRHDGELEYQMVPGRFLDFCRKAQNRSGACVLIIDEINRANLSRVFGELMYLLEYRDQAIPLSGGGMFRIPRNVRLLGTMNTADRSIALVDHALRRRFAFVPLRPRFEILRTYHEATGKTVDSLIEKLTQVNKAIADPNYHLGITFFMDPDVDSNLEAIWRMEIEPYLEEFFFDDPDTVDRFRWARIAEELGV
jgi:5-methylcytosine-specific restriction protein B